MGAGETQSDQCFHQGPSVGGGDGAHGRRGGGGGQIKPMCLVHILAPLDNQYSNNQIFCEWSNQLICNQCSIESINHIPNWVGVEETQNDLCFHRGSYLGGVDGAQGHGGKIKPMSLVHILAPFDNR